MSIAECKQIEKAFLEKFKKEVEVTFVRGEGFCLKKNPNPRHERSYYRMGTTIQTVLKYYLDRLKQLPQDTLLLETIITYGSETEQLEELE